MTTDVGDDNLAEFDWDRLVTWFAGLCRSERASDCLPAALWLVCSSEPPVGPGSGASPSEREALRALVTQLRERFSCPVAGQPVPRAIQSPGPLTWKMFAENLKAALFAQPDLPRVYLWFTIDFFRHFGSHLDLADPAASEIRALLDFLDLYHPDLLPAVRRMASSLPAAREVLSRWQPSELSPAQKIVKKMLDFALDTVQMLQKNLEKAPDLLDDLGAQLAPLALRFFRASENVPEDQMLTDLPIAALHRVDQIIDDPTLSIGGKSTEILQVLTQAVQGKVVSH